VPADRPGDERPGPSNSSGRVRRIKRCCDYRRMTAFILNNIDTTKNSSRIPYEAGISRARHFLRPEIRHNLAVRPKRSRPWSCAQLQG